MKCPGQDTKYWKPDAIFSEKCPKCGGDVEFFKDDTARKCPSCNHRFVNPKMDFGCAAYCQFAEQCIGALPPEVVAQKENFLKDKIAVEMKKHYKRDFKKIGFASRTARYVEEIGKSHEVNTGLVLAAGYLIGMTQNGDAKEVMEKAGAPLPFINKVQGLLNIIKTGVSPDKGASPEVLIVHDAKKLAELEESVKENSVTDAVKEKIESIFLTENGKTLAARILKS